MTHAEYLATRRFAGLDGLRALAIVAVVWHHSENPFSITLGSRGFLGVDLFFVLSGFLICTLLLRERSATGRISLRNFWVRRILRLVPAYYALLIVLVVAYVWLKPGDSDTENLLAGLPAYALYYSNWVVPEAPNLAITWSLSTEEQFYLVWPLLLILFRPMRLVAVWSAGFLLNQLVNFGFFDSVLLDVGFERKKLDILQVTFTPILLGVAIAQVLHYPQWFGNARRLISFRYSTLIYPALLLVVASYPVEDVSGWPRLLIHLLMAAWNVSLITRPGDKLNSILESSPIVFVGMISYGMYLYHMWCLHVVRAGISRIGASQELLQFPLALMITISVAAASFYMLERPFLQLRDRFR